MYQQSFQPNFMANNYRNPMQNTITWVQGIEGAKAYQLFQNSNILLMDSENDGMFYIKTSDSAGMCSLRRFKYQEITESPATNNLADYVRKDELSSLLKEILNDKPIISANDDEQITVEPELQRSNAVNKRK